MVTPVGNLTMTNILVPEGSPVQNLPNFLCRLCRNPVKTPALAIGPIPICNGFSKIPGTSSKISLNVVECETCQLVQLREMPASGAVIPQVPWIRYREPEDHLDALTAELLEIVPQARTAIGTGPFDRPLLSRLSARDLSCHQLALEIPSRERYFPYLESWQTTLTEPHLAAQAEKLGTFDVVSCRYIVEHTSIPFEALQAMKRLLKPGGILLVEVPDSSKLLKVSDYALLWEEHSCYFVRETLQLLGEASGYRILKVLRYPGVLEDTLVAIMCVEQPLPLARAFAKRATSSVFRAYRDGFAVTRKLLKNHIAQAAGPNRDRIALFGIGHHAIMFANAFNIADDIALAVDDDQDKIGFFPPGFQIPVVNSDRLIADTRIRKCLFAVAPRIERRMRDNFGSLAARGVEFQSIYAGVDNSIMKEAAP